MNAKNVMLSIFVLLTILFASLTLIEHSQTSTVTTTTATSGTTIMHTITLYTTSTSTSTTCANTGGIGCPHFFNETYTIFVSYTGPWGVSYQGYLGVGNSALQVESGSFYGHASFNQSVAVSGTNTYGITFCVEAQKLDSSSSTLVLRILPPVNVMNQTSLAYGTTKTCLADVIA